MVLNSAQAQAVYSAMCALNNVNGQLDARIDGVTVKTTSSGLVVVTKTLGGIQEAYSNQAAFARAYCLD